MRAYTLGCADVHKGFPNPFTVDKTNSLSKNWHLTQYSYYIKKYIHSIRPTLDTRVIEEYLSRYLLRIAVSNNRWNYDEIKKQVILIYNDYRNQLEGEVAPKKNRFFDPLSFIHQFIEHLPPRYFQRMRYYGLHDPATYRRIKDQIPSKLKRKSCTVRTLIQILKALLGVDDK